MAILYLNSTLKWNYDSLIKKILSKIDIVQKNDIGYGITQIIFNHPDYELNDEVIASCGHESKTNNMHFCKIMYNKNK